MNDLLDREGDELGVLLDERSEGDVIEVLIALVLEMQHDARSGALDGGGGAG